MLKDFLMRKMLKSQLKGVPEAEQEKLITMIEKNPDFFQKIATEVKEKMNGGMDQMAATQAVMLKHKEDLEKIMKP